MTARVVLLAQTILYRERLADTPYTERPFPSAVETVMACDELTEFAGRSVNGTWDEQKCGTNDEYLRALIELDETQLMEHSSATFWLTGVSVWFAKTVSDYPGFAVTEASFDYADPQKIGLVVPPAIQHSDELESDLSDYFEDAMTLYQDLIRDLVRSGHTRHQAVSAARAALPNCAETTVLMTGSLATYRYALSEWLLPASDAEAREVATTLLSELKYVAPNTFQDFVRDDPRKRKPLPEADYYETVNEAGSASYGERLSYGASRVA